MAKCKWINIGFVLLFVGLAQCLFSQEKIYNTFLVDSIGVGENVDLYITVDQKTPPAVNSIDLSTLMEMKFYPPITQKGDSVVAKEADLSINSMGSWQDSDKNGILEGGEINWEKVENGDTVLYRNKLNISFFDVGLYVFEGFPVNIDGRPVKTNPLFLKVNFKDYDLQIVDSTGLAPIKDIQRENLSIRDILPWLLYILIPLVLFFGISRFLKFQRNKKSEPAPEEIIIIPPDVIALTGLKDLRSKELWQNGKIKAYQSELSRIIREYLEGRYGIRALENTTSEIVRSIKDTSFDQDDQSKLSRILQISDLVKFAKAKPTDNIHEEFMDDAIAFVQKTKKIIEEENREEE